MTARHVSWRFLCTALSIRLSQSSGWEASGEHVESVLDGSQVMLPETQCRLAGQFEFANSYRGRTPACDCQQGVKLVGQILSSARSQHQPRHLSPLLIQIMATYVTETCCSRVMHCSCDLFATKSGLQLESNRQLPAIPLCR
jgi:hypothetical protein